MDDFDFGSAFSEWVIAPVTKGASAVQGYATSAFDYLDKHQWAADMAKGAAAAGGAYLMQKDQQKHEERLADKKYQREIDLKLQYSQAPILGSGDLNVGAGLLSAGAALQDENSLVQRKRVQ